MNIDNTLEVAQTVIRPFTRAELGFIPTVLELQGLDADIRYRYRGGVPSTSSGFLLYVGSRLTFDANADIENLRLIAVSGTATVIYSIA